MRPLLSEISFVMVAALLPKQALKTPFPMRKKYLPIQFVFPCLLDFLGGMSFLSKKKITGSKV